MKKWIAMALSLVLALSLTACGDEPEQPETPDPQPQEEEPKETETSQETSQETRDLEYFLEGEPATLPATRYDGDGYTIYIPSEGWLMETGDEDGFPTVEWEPEVNDDVQLEIVVLAGKTAEEARTWLTEEKDDYDLIEDKRGGLGGTSAEDGDVLEAALHEGDGAVYLVITEYPMEAMEGFGVTLSVVTDTFALTA